MNVKRRQIVSLYPDIGTKAFLEAEARKKHLDLSSFCLRMIAKGLAAEEMHHQVEAMRRIASDGSNDLLLKEVLALRYIVEQQAKGQVRNTVTLGTDANLHAAKKLTELRQAE